MLRDMNGEPIPYGRTKRTIEESFMIGSTLPSWITVTGTGNYTIVPPQTDYGYLQVNSGTNVNDVVNLSILPSGVNMSKVKELILEFDSFVFNNPFSDIQIFFDFLSADGQNGFQWIGLGDSIRGKKLGITTQKGAKFVFEVGRRRNFSLRIRNDRTVILMEHEGVVFEYQFSEAEMDINQVIFPKLAVKNLTAGEKNFRFSRIALSLVHN